MPGFFEIESKMVAGATPKFAVSRTFCSRESELVVLKKETAPSGSLDGSDTVRHLLKTRYQRNDDNQQNFRITTLDKILRQ